MNLGNLYKSIFLEVSALTAVFLSRNFYTVFIFFILHSLASFLISQIIVTLIPKRYSGKNIQKLLFFTFLNTVIIFVGYLASLYFVVVLFRKHKEKIKYEISFIDPFQELNIIPTVKRQLGEGITNIDFQIMPKEIKLRILKTFSSEINYFAIRIMKNLLMDNDSEIRLYSFETISRIKNNISKKINLELEKLKNANSAIDKARINKTLASLYFDMLELEISEESLKNFYITKAFNHIQEAEKIINDGEILFIKGKIFKYQKDYEKALDCFEMALKYRFDEHKVLPLIAEIYFEKGEYKKIKEVFRRDYSLKIDYTTSPFYEIWEGN